MRILVCGSTVLDPRFHEVARTIGEVIIERTSHTLMFGGLASKSGEPTADEVIAEGARAALQRRGQAAERRVTTMLPEKDEWPRFVLGATHIVREADAADRRAAMVGAADLVISLAGAIGTADVLDHTFRLRKTCIPLAFTGDASASAWKAHRTSIFETLHLTGDDIAFIEQGATPWPQHLLRLIGRANPNAGREQRLKVVVASPNDLRERTIVDDVVAELNGGIAAVLALRLEVARWETDSFPGFHVDGPQGLIDEILRIEDADLLVAMFWWRFGSGGTEHEIRKAWSAWKSNGRPQLMLYFCSQAYAPATDEERLQQEMVHAFRREVDRQGLLGSYGDPADFERQLRRQLTRYLRTNYGP